MRSTVAINRSFLLVMAVIGWLGVTLQLLVSVRLATDNGKPALYGVANALSYFTVMTNLLVTVIVTRRLSRGTSASRLTSRGTLAAAAVYVFVVGIIYSLLLRNLWAPTGLHKLADAILHDVMPLLYVLWWLLLAPKGGLNWKQPVQWLTYPLAYFLFAVLLGQLSGRYLYPFADVPALGFSVVLRNGLLLLLLFLGLGLCAVAIDRYASRVRPGVAGRTGP